MHIYIYIYIYYIKTQVKKKRHLQVLVSRKVAQARFGVRVLGLQAGQVAVLFGCQLVLRELVLIISQQGLQARQVAVLLGCQREIGCERV
jgi:hypothetical protein